MGSTDFNFAVWLTVFVPETNNSQIFYVVKDDFSRVYNISCFSNIQTEKHNIKCRLCFKNSILLYKFHLQLLIPCYNEKVNKLGGGIWIWKMVKNKRKSLIMRGL